MKMLRVFTTVVAVLMVGGMVLNAQTTTLLTLEDALKIALSESETVKIADKEVERTGYAKKGAYASLFPQIDLSGSYQRTLIKNDIRAMMGSDNAMTSMMKDTKIGSSNTFSLGATAAMPLVNAALWKSLKISGQSVELAVEKARGSRLNLVAQVKQAYYSAQLAKEVFNVYKDVYENAKQNYVLTELKYNAQKASELEMSTAKTSLANAIPNMYNAESNVILALWQLKAVIGMSLDEPIDVVGGLKEYSSEMIVADNAEDLSLDQNTTMRQLAIQADQLLETVKLRQLAYAPTLAIAANFTYSSVSNDPIKNLDWFPYSYAGLSLSIPIFSGGKRLNDVRQARNQYQQMQLQVQNTEKQMRILVRQKLASMETAIKAYHASQDALQSAQKAYDIAAKSYEVGRATLTQLNDAQLALTQSQLGVNQNVFNFISAKAELESVLGEDMNEVK
ncbi:MAG: TolC family protein [Bacteroidales bacterium]|nr:TolC family protein [Bacteroidales bacterium]